ncbi:MULTISPECIES: hypothetical protein [unclassified Bradyrhizobium]|uniref:hypothetical protein n=2 Tax=unclassified Bradyrhizobium TaxID=2631580 RepID=UPI0029167C63|nr:MULTISPECIES: hypothetical protein [unclassified Bradyrhizobium]
MHVAMKQAIAISIMGVVLTIGASAHAESAYIAQVNAKAGVTVSTTASQPVQLIPTASYVPRQPAYVPTPEAAQSARGNNIATTLQIGNNNRVLQAQSGGNNYSNVGTIGGSNNNVTVLQGGRDYSNVNLINTQSLNIAVLQPPGSAPINMLIAKLPNGSLLIKR